MNWFKDNPNDEILTPGMCECEHERCCHDHGKGRCRVSYPPDKEWPEGAECACQIFILDRDSGDGEGTPSTPVDPEVAELERMVSREGGGK